MKKIITFCLIIIFSGFLFCFAQAADPSNFNQASTKMKEFAGGLSFISGFDASVQNIVSSILLLVNSLFFIFMIYAGIMWFSANGNEEKIERAKTTIVWCVVGMAVTLGAYAITTFILNRVAA